MATHTIPTYIMALDDPGDIAAAPGSTAWARAMRGKLQNLLTESTTELRRFRNHLRHMDKERGYQQLDDPHGHPFPSLMAFCVARPPFGLGYDPDMVEAIQQETRNMLLGQKVAEVRALRTQALAGDEKVEPQRTLSEAMTGNTNAQKEENSGYGVTAVSDGEIQELRRTPGKRGNTQLYLVKRLKREAPAFAQALADGQYSSASAAAKAAGIDLEQRRVWLSADPGKAAYALTKKFSPAFLQAVFHALREESVI